MITSEIIKGLKAVRTIHNGNYAPFIDEAIKELKAKEWIPVSERLPEDGTWNLFTDGNNRSVERYKADALDHFYPDGRWFSFEEAIWWMPLSKLPKAESEEQ